MDWPSSSNLSPNKWDATTGNAAVNVTAGNNTKGSYVTLATTTRKTRQLGLVVYLKGSEIAEALFDIAIGGTPRIIVPDILFYPDYADSISTTTGIATLKFYTFDIDIAAGIAVKARVRTDGKNGTVYGATAYMGYR